MKGATNHHASVDTFIEVPSDALSISQVASIDWFLTGDASPKSTLEYEHHPHLGFEALFGMNGITSVPSMLVHQHHEPGERSGIPRGNSFLSENAFQRESI